MPFFSGLRHYYVIMLLVDLFYFQGAHFAQYVLEMHTQLASIPSHTLSRTTTLTSRVSFLSNNNTVARARGTLRDALRFSGAPARDRGRDEHGRGGERKRRCLFSRRDMALSQRLGGK